MPQLATAVLPRPGGSVAAAGGSTAPTLMQQQVLQSGWQQAQIAAAAAGGGGMPAVPFGPMGGLPMPQLDSNRAEAAARRRPRRCQPPEGGP